MKMEEKIENGRWKVEGGKVTKIGEDFFFFLLVTFQNN